MSGSVQEVATGSNGGGPGGCGKLMEKALILDVYGRQVRFMLPNNQQRYKSIFGSCCTVLILSIVFIYAVYKYDMLRERKQDTLQILKEID